MLKKYGFFSAEHCSLSGSVYYAGTSLDKIEVTTVSNDVEASFYKWSDKVFVGEVLGYISGKMKLTLSEKEEKPINIGLSIAEKNSGYYF